MRPRPEGRGEPVPTWRTTDAWDASMRPRPEGRGEPRATWPISSMARSFNAATTRRSWRTKCGVPRVMILFMLQCGHDPKVVENPANTADGYFYYGLQCGHDPKVVENSAASCRGPGQGSCFNAATTRRSWRTRGGQHDRGTRPRASMRPRPEGRGERNRGEAISSPGPRFNAATTRRSWRTPGENASPHREVVLQCGHDPKVVENAECSCSDAGEH